MHAEQKKASGVNTTTAKKKDELIAEHTTGTREGDAR